MIISSVRIGRSKCFKNVLLIQYGVLNSNTSDLRLSSTFLAVTAIFCGEVCVESPPQAKNGGDKSTCFIVVNPMFSTMEDSCSASPSNSKCTSSLVRYCGNVGENATF